MVSRLARTARVEIAGKTFTPAKIEEGLKITWGRRSIWEPPAKRSAAMRLVLSQAEATEAKGWLGRVISVYSNSVMIFTGTVDSLIFPNDLVAGQLVELHAVEVVGWNTDLKRTISTSATMIMLLKGTLVAQGIQTNLQINDPLPDRTFLRPPATAEEIDALTAYGALVSSRPLAQPIWNANYTTLSPSIYRRDHTWKDVVIPAEMVSGSDWEISADHLPRWVEWWSGGDWGEKQLMSKGPLTSPGAGTIITEKPVAVRSYDDGDMTRARELLNAQQSNPRTFTLSDQLAELRPQYADLFKTTEQHVRFSINNGPIGSTTPAAQLDLAAAAKYAAIGGTLTIRPAGSHHEITCIYV